MKKYLLGIVTVVVAICLSAFNIEKKLGTDAADSNSKSQTAYFWYDLRSDGKIAGGVLNGTTDIKANVIEGGSNQLTTCSDVSLPYCLAGCSSSTLGAGDTPDAPTGSLDNRIKND